MNETLESKKLELVSVDNFPMSDDLKNLLHDIKNDHHQSLDDLANQIREAEKETVRSANNAVEGALITGTLLIEAKKKLIHGEWESWLSNNCNVSVRTAQAYMRLAKSLPLDAPNTQRVALLPLREAIKAISTNQNATVRQPDIPRIAGCTERQKSCAVFSKAIHALKSFHANVENSADVKGSDAVALRKKLTAALVELDRLESMGVML